MTTTALTTPARRDKSSTLRSLQTPQFYNVYAVDSCLGPEGATSSASSVTALPVNGGYQDGYDAVKYDMIGGGPNNDAVGCFHKTQ